MASLIVEEELKKRLFFYYNRLVLNQSKDRRLYNIESFNSIDRSSLKYNNLEKRLLLYTTLLNEKIYIQYPGKESALDDKPKPYDFRPELSSSSGAFISSASFGDIWDSIDYIAKRHNAYLSIIAAIFLRIGYMCGYKKVLDSYSCEEINYFGGKTASKVDLEWYLMGIDDDIWYTLNDRIGLIPLTDGMVSIEAFFKYVDLLFQNEDCKYYYINKVINGKTNYNLTSGRNSSSDTNLSIISYCKGDNKMSALIDSVSKGRGIASFRKSDYENVTDGIVINQ